MSDFNIEIPIIPVINRDKTDDFVDSLFAILSDKDFLSNLSLFDQNKLKNALDANTKMLEKQLQKEMDIKVDYAKREDTAINNIELSPAVADNSSQNLVNQKDSYSEVGLLESEVNSKQFNDSSYLAIEEDTSSLNMSNLKEEIYSLIEKDINNSFDSSDVSDEKINDLFVKQIESYISSFTFNPMDFPIRKEYLFLYGDVGNNDELNTDSHTSYDDSISSNTIESEQNNLGINEVITKEQIDAIYSEFEVSSAEYRDNEIVRFKEMLDTNLISIEKYNEEVIRLNEEHYQRLSSVKTAKSSIEAVEDNSYLQEDKTVSDNDSSIDKTEKKLTSLEKVLMQKSSGIKTAVNDLSTAVGSTLTNLFEANSSGFKESANKMLKSLADLLKKTASAAISNIILGSMGLAGATSGLGALLVAPLIKSVVSSAIDVFLSPVLSGLSLATGGRANSPVDVVIGDNPYSPEWVLRDFDILAIIDKSLEKFMSVNLESLRVINQEYQSVASQIKDKITIHNSESENSLESKVLEYQIENIIIQHDSLLDRFISLNKDSELIIERQTISDNTSNPINIDTSSIIDRLDKLIVQFSDFEGRIHILESDVAVAANRYNYNLNKRSYS